MYDVKKMELVGMTSALQGHKLEICPELLAEYHLLLDLLYNYIAMCTLFCEQYLMSVPVLAAEWGTVGQLYKLVTLPSCNLENIQSSFWFKRKHFE
jgi:hypothetical protein